MKYIFNSACSPVTLICSTGSYHFNNGDECFNQELLRKFPQLFRVVDDTPIAVSSVPEPIKEEIVPLVSANETLTVPTKRKAGRPFGAKTVNRKG